MARAIGGNELSSRFTALLCEAPGSVCFLKKKSLDRFSRVAVFLITKIVKELPRRKFKP